MVDHFGTGFTPESLHIYIYIYISLNNSQDAFFFKRSHKNQEDAAVSLYAMKAHKGSGGIASPKLTAFSLTEYITMC